MNAALTAKILAKRAKADYKNACTGIQRFLANKNEKRFVTAMATGLESESIEHYLNMWRSTSTTKLNKINCLAMKNILGTEIDLQNILWMYRLKKYYGIFGDSSYGFLIPIRYRLSDNVFSNLVNCTSIENFISELSKTIYHNVFGNFLFAQQSLTKAVKLRYRTESRRSYIALACGYLYEAHLQEKNKAAMAEGIRHGLDHSEILSRLY